MRMQYKTIGEINHYASENVNPARFPEQYFELYSVPHFSEGYPEIIKGKDVGATKQVVQEGDVLICKINPRINRVWKVTRHTDYPLIASSEWVIVRNADLNADYLTYYFSSPKFRVLINSELTGMGGSLTRAQPKQIRRYSVPVPDKEEQHFVVRNLALLDHLISLRQRQAEKLDELVKARFVEMFGDPISNPHAFARVSLSELAEIKIGPFGSLLHKEDYVHGEHPLINPSHIINGKIVIDENFTVSDEKYIELEAYHLRPGDVVLGRRGEMGRCAVVEREGYLCGTGSLLIRTNGQVTADYIQKTISFPAYKRMIEDMAVGQTMQNLNVPIVSKFPIVKPPLDVQKRYYHFVHEIDCEKERIQKSAALLETLKRSLMQQYFG